MDMINDIKIYIVLEDKIRARALNINGNINLLRALLEVLTISEFKGFDGEQLIDFQKNQQDKPIDVGKPS